LTSYDPVVIAETIAAAALICLDPGHGTPPAIGRQREPIGPGSRTTKIKDGGGAAGEAEIVLAIARRARALLLRRGYRVAMTREGPTFRGGNIERAQFCNRRGAALMLRIHADGSPSPAQRGVSTLTPAGRRGWTDDVYSRSRRAARAVQRELVRATGARDLGVVERSDLTGFNWADVPVVLAETGFLSNSTERRLLRSSSYQWGIARGLAAGVAAFTPPA
jgi:N-acetylmuramoyl-L-alanine amidase